MGPYETVVRPVGEALCPVCRLDSKPLLVPLKCDPEESLALLQEFLQITPGYHMNKKQWITIVLDSGIPDDLAELRVRGSHELVRGQTPRPPRPSPVTPSAITIPIKWWA